MRRILAALLTMPLLAGCVVSNVAQRQAELAAFIGSPEADLVRTFGVPARTYEVGGKRFLAYTERRLDVLPGGYGGFGGYGRFGYGGGFPADVVERVCETTFELDNARVTAATLRGNAC